MKNIFIGIILSSFLLSSRPNVQAQGSLLKGGESGIGFLGSYARTSETSAIQATAIGTLAGTLDLGVFVGSVDNELTHQSISGTGVAMELYFVRDTPHRRTPIEISIFGEYGVFKSQKFYALGGSIFRRTDDTRKAFIQPFLTVSGSWQEKYNQSETSVALGVSIALKMAEASVFHVTPSFGKAGDGIAFGVDAGFVFGKARRHNTAVKKENEKQWEF